MAMKNTGNGCSGKGAASCTRVRNRASSTALPLVLVLTLLSVTGCSFARQSVAALRSTNDFVPSARDDRVLSEPGAETYAEKVASFLPASIEQVETKQYGRFVEPVRVYVCMSRESFKRHYGADVRAGVLRKLFVSPRMFDYGDEIARRYLTHELSHLHLQQQLGIYKTSRLPMWFKEGLATYTSEGGGAHLTSPEQAIESMRTGKALVPNKSDGFIFKTSPADCGLEPHMFYRQSMMFIMYLAKKGESGFRGLLLSVERGEYLPAALHEAYRKSLEELWEDFLNEVAKQSNSG